MNKNVSTWMVFLLPALAAAAPIAEVRTVPSTRYSIIPVSQGLEQQTAGIVVGEAAVGEVPVAFDLAPLHSITLGDKAPTWTTTQAADRASISHEVAGKAEVLHAQDTLSFDQKQRDQRGKSNLRSETVQVAQEHLKQVEGTPAMDKLAQANGDASIQYAAIEELNDGSKARKSDVPSEQTPVLVDPYAAARVNPGLKAWRVMRQGTGLAAATIIGALSTPSPLLAFDEGGVDAHVSHAKTNLIFWGVVVSVIAFLTVWRELTRAPGRVAQILLAAVKPAVGSLLGFGIGAYPGAILILGMEIEGMNAIDFPIPAIGIGGAMGAVLGGVIGYFHGKSVVMEPASVSLLGLILGQALGFFMFQNDMHLAAPSVKMVMVGVFSLLGVITGGLLGWIFPHHEPPAPDPRRSAE